MKIHKTTTIKKKIGFLDIIQYIIGIFIILCFVIGLIPFTYSQVFYFIIPLIVLQIIISLLRLKILNVILEIIILALSILSIIPLIGYGFRFLGIFAEILDMSSFKNPKIYKYIDIKVWNFNNKENPIPKKNQIQKTKEKKYNIKDADFKEK